MRIIIHKLKYGGVSAIADFLATAMAPLLSGEEKALVPVPRVWSRKLRYGIDPAVELTRSLGRITGLPMRRALRPPLWAPHHAAKSRNMRVSPEFSLIADPGPAILVDDVVTTGSTLMAAEAVIPNVRLAVTSTVRMR